MKACKHWWIIESNASATINIKVYLICSRIFLHHTQVMSTRTKMNNTALSVHLSRHLFDYPAFNTLRGSTENRCRVAAISALGAKSKIDGSLLAKHQPVLALAPEQILPRYVVQSVKCARLEPTNCTYQKSEVQSRMYVIQGYSTHNNRWWRWSRLLTYLHLLPTLIVAEMWRNILAWRNQKTARTQSGVEIVSPESGLPG